MGTYRAYLPVMGIGAGVVLALIMARKISLIPPVADLASGAASVVVDVADGALRGTVEGLGLVIGIPKTDLNKCQRDVQNGDMWEASFSCPAKTFLGAAWDRF